MNQIYNKVKLKNILFVFYIICITDTMFCHANANTRIIFASQLSIGIFLVIFFMKIYISNNKLISNAIVISILIPLFFLTLGMILNLSISGGYILKAILIILGVLITNNFKFEKFCEIFTKIMIFIAIYSLIAYILSYSFVPYVNNVLNKFPVLDRAGIQYFYNLFFTNIPVGEYYRHRNYGIFWEPGAYQAYLNIAIVMLLFVKFELKRKKLSLVILIIAVLTTLSTTGYFALIIILSAYVFDNNGNIRNRIAKEKLFLIGLFICGIFFIISNDYLIDKVFGKLSMGIESSSYSARFLSISYNLKIFLSNPIVGVGPRKYAIMFEELVKLNPSIWAMQTNTILGMFATYGVVIGGIFVYLLWKVCNRIGTNYISTLLIFMAFVVLLFMEDFNYSMFFNVFVYWGIFYGGSFTKHDREFSVY